jgi:hypothetical protein
MHGSAKAIMKIRPNGRMKLIGNGAIHAIIFDCVGVVLKQALSLLIYTSAK